MRDLFASDYGVLSRDFFSVGYVSNAAELIRGEETYRILRLCGIDEGKGGDAASDWELFFSFCKAYPLLRGHLVAERKGELLRAHLGTSLPFSEETAEQLWRESTLHLAASPMRAHALLSHDVPWLCDGEELPDTLPEFLSPMLDATVLAARRGETFGAWHTRLCTVVERFSRAGCAGVLLRLPADFSFAEPNVYAVGEALGMRRQSREAANLLLSQLVREISEACIACRLPLLLECECGGTVGALLRYVRRTVGIPELCACARDAFARDALLDFAAESDIRIALRLADVPTEAELSFSVESLAARYPIGRVRLVTGADLRESAAAQRQAERLLCRITEKKL